ncbi:Ger(x)C family spore germination protein [Gorillibacterium sp. sgz500922]|uniref:Ger(x)C family spore germination protein n=1 Tax=Gorillibacterium sp. sgz500922 TaxID=3446694 RepID=UPI003F66D489
MKRNRRGLLALILLSVALTGCWDRVELNDMAFILATGIDAAPDDKLDVSLEIPIPAKMGKKSSGGDPFTIVATEGSTMRDITQINNTRMSRRLTSSHRRVLIIGEDMAKRGIRPLFDNFTRVPENRLNGILVVAKGKASDLLKGKTPVDEFSWEALREIIRGRGKTVNNVKNVAQALSTPQIDPVVVYMGTIETKENGPGQIKLLGYAQFKEDKMVGVYEGDEMLGIHWLAGQVTPHEMTYRLSNGQMVTVYVLEGTTQIEPVRMPGNRIKFDIEVRATCFVLEDMGVLDMNDLDNIRMISKETGQQIKKHIEKSLERMQQMGTDSVALGNRINRKYPRLWRDRLGKDWRDSGLKQADYEIHSEVTVSHTGLVSDNPAREEHRK